LTAYGLRFRAYSYPLSFKLSRFEMNITHMDNRTVLLRHDAVSTPGFSKTVPNEGMPVLGGGGSYGDLIVFFDIEFPKKLDEEEKELLSAVLDEEEIKNIENMILKRNIKEVVERFSGPIGHAMRHPNGVETFNMANVVDISSEVPYHGVLTEWELYATSPGEVWMQVWRPAPLGADFPDHCYSLMGESRIVVDKAGLTKSPLKRENYIMCEPGDVLGWRLDSGDAVLGFEPAGDGHVRITKSPSLPAELGRTEHFPFSIVRTYPFSAKVVSVVLLFEEQGCSGERVEVMDQSMDFCSLRFLTGGEVNDRVQSILLPPALRVELWKDCGGGGDVSHAVENRASPSNLCADLEGGFSHVRLTRHG